MAVGLGLLLPLLLLLVVPRGDILEGDCAFDFLAGEDGLVVPVDKDTDVARVFGRRHDAQRAREPSARVGGVEAELREEVLHLRRLEMEY